MKQKNGTRTIVITGLLLALEIIFQVIGNFVAIGPANINLTLVTVAIAGILCGPMSAAILGFFNGIMALFSPSTIAIFMPISPYGTVLVCLVKCTVAGIVSAYVFRWLRKKNQILALIVASALVPVVNTGIFCLGALAFFQDWLKVETSKGGFANIGLFLILAVVGINFLVEFASTTLITPTVGTILLKREEKIQNK